MFTFGKLFFKKYLFTFSFDNKIIGFYNDKLPNSENINHKNISSNENNKLKSKILLLIFSLVFIFIIVFVFVKIKKKYLNDRQKRMNELIDNNYIYMTNQAADKINCNEKSLLN